ncbi:putative MFS transporter [Aureobasidium subglaciale]|nr:putative MFS transporter [Aureobasidium subglaciale]
MAQAWMGNETGFYVTRALIGTCEGAFQPMAVIFLADFYTNTELAFRIAILASGVNIAKALTSLEAAGILKMRGVADRPGMLIRLLQSLASDATNTICVGWFWLFLINGLLIFLIGLMGIFYLPAGPTRTQGVFWRKPWFTNRERGSYETTLRKGRWGLRHVQVYVMFGILCEIQPDTHRSRTALIGFWVCASIIYIPRSPVSLYLVLNLRQLGFSKFASSVLTIPSDFLRVITMLALTRSSGHFKEKAFHCMLPPLLDIPLFTALLLLPSHGYAWARFAILTLIIGAPNSHPIITSWIACNSFDPKKRGIAIALFSTIHEVGSVAAAQIYREKDKPYYYQGNKVLVSICAAAVIATLLHREALRHINRKKQRAWKNLSEVEQRDYDQNQGHSIGNKSLTFKFPY